MSLTILLVAACAPAAQLPPTQPAIHFRDIAAEVGLDFTHGAFRWDVSGDPVAMMGGGLCWLDYDGDGWIDLFVVNSYAVAEAGRWEQNGGLPRSALFRNVNGRFQDVGRQSGAALPLRGNGCVAADLDNDGHTDLYVTTDRTNVLLWNQGDGTFVDGSAAAGVDMPGWQTAVVAGDLNGDGRLDLVVAGYVNMNRPFESASMGFPNTHEGERDLLFLNEGAAPGVRPTFREVGLEIGLESGPAEYGLGALLSDVDGDADLDLFIANDTNPNRLYENVAIAGGIGFHFVERGAVAAVDDRNSGMGVAGGDYDGDGRFDLFVTNMGAQLHSVYQNATTPAGTAFEAAADRLGISGLGVGQTGWGVTWADFDLDGDVDLLLANGGIPVLDPQKDGQLMRYYANLGAQGRPGQFAEETAVTGLEALGPLLARGSAAADYDNDGDLDIAVNVIGGRLVLLENSGSRNHWLTVTLDGLAAGAVVTAVLPDGRRLTREMHAGSSYLSSEDPRCHFGLGMSDRVAALHVRWPGGRTSSAFGVPANQHLFIKGE